MSSSFALLREYEHKLKDLVRSKFTEARNSNNLEGIERYGAVYVIIDIVISFHILWSPRYSDIISDCLVLISMNEHLLCVCVCVCVMCMRLPGSSRYFLC